MRQLVGESGSVGLAQTSDPYGNGFAKAGSASSRFGYSGEQVDANGFVYLRARYYNPSMGRFFQMDPSRQEKNPYLYAASNPVILRDPTGLIADPNSNPYYSTWTEAEEAFKVITEIEAKYEVHIDVDFGWSGINQLAGANGETASLPTPIFIEYGGSLMHLLGKVSCRQWVEGNWQKVSELKTVKEALEDITTRLGGTSGFRAAMGPTQIVRDKRNRNYFGLTVSNRIYLYDKAFTSIHPPYHGKAWTKFTVAHELGHRWDRQTWAWLSREMRRRVTDQVCILSLTIDMGISVPLGCITFYTEQPPDVGDRYVEIQPPSTEGLEDWAESFAAYVYDDFPPLSSAAGRRLGPIRRLFIEEQIAKLP